MQQCSSAAMHQACHGGERERRLCRDRAPGSTGQVPPLDWAQLLIVAAAPAHAERWNTPRMASPAALLSPKASLCVCLSAVAQSSSPLLLALCTPHCWRACGEQRRGVRAVSERWYCGALRQCALRRLRRHNRRAACHRGKASLPLQISERREGITPTANKRCGSGRE